MSPKTIFVVDDSEIVLEMARDALESADYRVETMANWSELDENLKAEIPDLIVMDVQMPEAYGDTALMFFKETRGIKGTPILLFSDIPVEELTSRAKECAADGFVSKSWGFDRLLEEVSDQLST